MQSDIELKSEELKEALLETETPQPQEASKSYLLYAFFSCFFFGCGNYVWGYLSGEMGVAGGYTFFIGNAIIWAGYHLVIAIEARMNKGDWHARERSIYIDQKTNEICWMAVFTIFQRSITIIAAYFLFFYSMETAVYAGVNQGIIASLFNISTLFNALGFYLVFNENLNKRHVIGIFLMFSAVMLIINGAPSDTSVAIARDPDSNQEHNLWLSVIFALLATLVLSLAALLNRYYQMKTGMSSIQLNVDSSFLASFYFLAAYLYYTSKGGIYSTEIILISILASFLIMIGSVCITYAIETGMGGPAFAISNMACIVQTGLVVFFFGNLPSLTQNFGMLLGFAGAFAICEGEKIFVKSEKQV